MKLEEVLKQIDEQEQETSFQPFIVCDLETAAEAQRRIAYFDDKKEEINKIVEEQLAPFLAKIEKIKQWGEEAKREYDEKQSFYANQLEYFMREEVAKQLESGKKPKKTIKLPYGAISLKKQQPEFIKDEESLFDYAKEAGFVKVKESTDWASLKKACKNVGDKLVDENGVVVPGIRIVEKEDKFELKLDK